MKIENSLYLEVTRKEESRILILDDFDPQTQLEKIAGEIKARVKITQQEIFIIGKLLCMAKPICQQALPKRSFQEWITKSFDFSYETAKNFMNVYRLCMGIGKVAMQVPVSILYKVSAPGCPDEVKNWLFADGHLEKITNGEFTSMIKKFREGGFEAIAGDVEQTNHRYQIYQQSNSTINICRTASNTLQQLYEKLEYRFRDTSCYPSAMNPEAKEICEKLWDAIGEAHGIMNKAVEDSEKLLDQYKEEVFQG